MSLRFNQQDLIFYSLSPTYTKKGWLNKKGDSFSFHNPAQTFKKRWFVLKGNFLFYFEDDTEKSPPIGFIVLEQCCFKPSPQDLSATPPNSFQIAFVNQNSRTYVLSAETKWERDEWINALRCTGTEAMLQRLKEKELEIMRLKERNAQLERLLGETDGEQVRGSSSKSSSTPSLLTLPRLAPPSVDLNASRKHGSRESLVSGRGRDLFGKDDKPTALVDALNAEAVNSGSRKSRSNTPSKRNHKTRPLGNVGRLGENITASAEQLASKGFVVLDKRQSLSAPEISVMPLSPYQPISSANSLASSTEDFRFHDVTITDTSMESDGLQMKAIQMFVNVQWKTSYWNTRNSPSTELTVVFQQWMAEESSWQNIGQTEIVDGSQGVPGMEFFVSIALSLSLLPETARHRLCFYSHSGLGLGAARSLGFAHCGQDVLLNRAMRGARNALELDVTRTAEADSNRQETNDVIGTALILSSLKNPVAGLSVLLPHPYVSYSQFYKLPLSPPKTGHSSGSAQEAFLRIEECLSESYFSFSVPYLLVQLFQDEDERSLQRILSMEIPTTSAPDFELVRMRTVHAHRQRLARYETLKTGLEKELKRRLKCGVGPFRKSVEKKVESVQWVATNCCVHEMRMEELGGSRNAIDRYHIVTMGAPCAHALGFASNQLPSVSIRKNETAPDTARITLLAASTAAGGLREQVNDSLRIFCQCTDRLRQQAAEGSDNGSFDGASQEAVLMVKEMVASIQRIVNSLDVENSVHTSSDTHMKIREELEILTNQTMSRHVPAFLAAAKRVATLTSCKGDEAGSAFAELSPALNALSNHVDTLAKKVVAVLDHHVATLGVRSNLSTVATESVQFAEREDMCLSQCITGIVTAVTCMINDFFESERMVEKQDDNSWFWFILMHVGHYIQFESLLSTFGDERGMLTDFVHAVRSLENGRLKFRFHVIPTESDFESANILSAYLSPPNLRFSGYRACITFSVGVSRSDFDRLPTPLKQGESISVYPVLFSQGINEQQTLSNLMGGAGLQEKVNEYGMRATETFVQRWYACSDAAVREGVTSAVLARRWKSQVKSAFSELERTVCGGGEEKPSALSSFARNFSGPPLQTIPLKNTHLLLSAENLTRKLGRPPSDPSIKTPIPSVTSRVTSCKSAKDRTGMSVTLEQVAILYEYQTREGTEDEALVAERMKHLLDAMRGEQGTRLRNVERNLSLDFGKGRFAFNVVQWKLLPTAYRPPRRVIGAGPK